MDCLNKYLMDNAVRKRDVIMSEDLCEGCGEWKMCVSRIKMFHMRGVVRRMEKNCAKECEENEKKL